MKTDELVISQEPEKLGVILDKIELIALYTGMSRRDASSMRLLAEELLTATKDIMEAYDGRLWMETSEDEFTLHLRAAKPASKKERDELVALSTTGEVAAPKGLFSKLSAALSKLMTMDDDVMDGIVFPDYSLFGDSLGMGGPVYSYRYLPLSVGSAQQPKDSDEYAGIEKSIIDAIVDDILVMMPSGFVEIEAIKKLKK